MVAVKRSILRSVNSLIVLLIALLGFNTSCEEPAEYGTPHAKFVLRGTITPASDSKPIPDIIVEMRDATQDDSLSSSLINTGFSDWSGRYNVSAYGFPQDQTYRLRFVDTDGPLNGEYESLDTTVVFQDPVFVKGDGSWYSGYAEKELNIQLKAKE